MAPYGGPTIAQLIPLLKKGLPDSVALGFGIPKATLTNKDGTFELRGLSGGEGFGVQADLVNPFVDTGVLFQTTRWQDVIAWLCENWAEGWGDALKKGEQLRIHVEGAEAILATKLKAAAEACRAARA